MDTYQPQIIDKTLLQQFRDKVDAKALISTFSALEDAELSNGDFSFYTSAAAVYSSKIEGEPIELDSYIKHKRLGIEFQPDYTRKIDDLYLAYQISQDHTYPPKRTFQKFTEYLPNI